MDGDPHGVSMRKPRRVGYDDFGGMYPIPEEIAECESPGQDDSGDERGEIEKNVDVPEIEAIIDCLACFLGGFVGLVQSRASRDSHLKWSVPALLLILLIGIVAYTTHINKDAADQLKRLNPIKARTTLMTAETKVKTQKNPALKPVEHPVIGVISTHHRSGTVLFQTMVERLSLELLIDYDHVAEPFKLGDFTATPAVVFHRYWNATGRVVVGMHGFAETCEKGQNVGAYCPPVDYKCWLDACVFIDQKPEGKQVPIVHVVRNPVEFLISSYLYHIQDPPPEDWLYKPNPHALVLLPQELREKFGKVPYHEVLKQLPSEHGMLVDFVLGKGEIYQMARNYRDLEKKSYAKNLRLEDIKKDFKTTIKSTLDHLKITHLYSAQKVMDIAMIFDLDSMPEAERSAYHTDDHITEGKHNKDDLRQLLYNNPSMRDMLEGLAGLMGYDNAFPSMKNGTESVITEKMDLAPTR